MAKEALNIFFKSIPANSYFNVVRFGTEYKTLFAQSQPYDTKANIKAFKKLLEDVKANMSNTNIFEPLSYVLKQPKINGLL